MFLGELAEAQKGAANKLCARKKMLLSWPQGTGKTVVSLASSEKLLELSLITNVLILCPTGIAWQWQEKIKEFTTNDVRLVEAKSRSSRQYSSHRSIYTVVPYSVFRKDSEEILKVPFDTIIADEAQEFSSFRSRTFKLIKKFRSTYRWALTGTAISNKLEELYAILQWVDPYFLPNWKVFEERHIVRNPYTKQILRYKGLEELNKYLLSKRVERKTVNELQGLLPEVITHKIYIEKDKEVTNAESALYSTLRNNIKPGVQRNSFTSFDPEVSEKLHTARQALSGRTKVSYASDLLRRILSEAESNRVVVFSFYKRPLYELHKLHSMAKLFTGDESSESKQEAIKAFADGETRLLLCSNAGKAGLDLPFANYVIHLDVPFSHGIADQRSTRVRRISSTFSTVVVIYLLVKNSIEDYYFQITGNKGQLAKAVFDGGSDKVTMRPQSLREFLATEY